MKRLNKTSTFFWLLIALVLVAPAKAQCQRIYDAQSGQWFKYCPEENQGWEPARTIQAAPQGPVSGHCRVQITDGRMSDMGSGTLTHKDEQHGLVMTCSHIFDGAKGRIIVTFRDGSRFGANLVDRDRPNDLALLKIRAPRAEPIPPYDRDPSGTVTAGGFGGDGQFRQISGAIVGKAIPQGARHGSTIIRGSVRPGDSGGGAFCDGRFVGVVWGTEGGETYLTCGEPVRRMLSARLAKAEKPPVTLAQYGSTGGVPGYGPPPTQPFPPTSPYPPPPGGPQEPIRECDCADRWDELNIRLENIEKRITSNTKLSDSLFNQLGIVGEQITKIQDNQKFQFDQHTNLSTTVNEIKDQPAPTGPSTEDIIKALPPFWLRLVDENKKPRTEYAEIHLGNRADIEIDTKLSPATPVKPAQ